MNAEEREKVSLRVDYGSWFGDITSGTRGVRVHSAAPRKKAHRLHGLILRLPIEVVRARERIISGRAFRLPKLNELTGLRERQRPQEDGINYGEYRRVGADAESEGNDAHDRETGILQKHAGGVFDVLPESSHCSYSLIQRAFLKRGLSTRGG